MGSVDALEFIAPKKDNKWEHSVEFPAIIKLIMIAVCGITNANVVWCWKTRMLPLTSLLANK